MLSIEFSVVVVAVAVSLFLFQLFRKIFVCLLYTIKNDFSCGAVLREETRICYVVLRNIFSFC